MKKLLGSVVFVVSAVLLSACGGGGASGSGSVSGDAPFAFGVKSAFLIHYTSGSTTVPEVLMTDQSWSCDDLKGSGNTEPGAFVVFGFANTAGDVAAGEFQVTDGSTGSGNIASFQATSGSDAMAATEGSVTVSELTNDHIKGTFQVDDGTTHLTGDFDAPLCDINLGE